MAGIAPVGTPNHRGVCMRTLKRPRRSAPRNRGNGADAKDELLCDLELKQTLAAKEIEKLERAQKELEDSRNDFAAIFAMSPIGYITLDQRGHVRNANDAFLALTGFDRERVLRLP